MNKWIKRGLNLVLFIVGFNAAEKLCHELTDGFTLQRVLGCSETPTSPPSPEVKEILQQKFSYFARGNQCYVFASVDGKYVLKLFKYAENAPTWMGKIPLLNKFKAFRPWRLEARAWKKERDTLGYKVADEAWKEETGLLYVHLAKGEDLPSPCVISDKLHIDHKIDLNGVNFVLQKRAAVLHETLTNWMQTGQKEKAEAALAAAIDFCVLKASRGILDDDGALHNNLGFIEGKLIQLDPGHFQHHVSEDPRKEAKHSLRHLKKWVEEYQPELAPYVEDRLSRL